MQTPAGIENFVAPGQTFFIRPTYSGIEPEEAEECFFHDYDFCNHERFDDLYILDGRTDRGRRLRLVFQDKGFGSLAFLRVGSSNPKRREKDEEAIWQVA